MIVPTETVEYLFLRLDWDAWSMVKILRQATNEHTHTPDSRKTHVGCDVTRYSEWSQGIAELQNEH